MAILSKGTTFAEDDQVTHTNLNALVDSAKFVKAGAEVASSGNTTDETTMDINGSGELIVGVIATANIADDAVETAKIADANVTLAKMASASVNNAALTPTAGTAAVAGSGTGATGTNVIEASSIGSGDLNNDVISGQTELTDPPDNADEFLVSDGGVLKKIGVDTLLESPAFPQAYGVVTFDGSATLTSTYNVSSASDPDGDRVRITLSNAMADTNYVIQATFERTGSTSTTSVGIYAKTTTTFDLTVDVSKASGKFVNFVVYGTIA